MKWLKYFENYKKKWLVVDKEYTQSLYQKELLSFQKYYGNLKTDELDHYLWQAQSIFDQGGKLYRGLYANSIEEIDQTNLGGHWVMERYIVQNLLENPTFDDSYNSGYQKRFLVEIYTPPGNISIKHVDLDGNPEEMEVNIVDFTLIKIQQITEL